MRITRRRGIEGARLAIGPTVVIDVFRAFSAAAYAIAAGAEQLILAETVAEAGALAQVIPGSVLMGEVGGMRPDGFDLGNSPGEIVAAPQRLAGRTVIHRSSSGTRCARAAHAARAGPIYVSSLVVASATARVLRGSPQVTIVAAGFQGEAPATEDEICGDLIEQLLSGGDADVPAATARVASLDRADQLRQAEFTHKDDVALCIDTDRFDFAMLARDVAGRLTLAQA